MISCFPMVHLDGSHGELIRIARKPLTLLVYSITWLQIHVYVNLVLGVQRVIGMQRYFYMKIAVNQL